MATQERHVEVLSARRYYGRHATGTVVLVNGHPTHFTGDSAAHDAEEFARKADPSRAPSRGAGGQFIKKLRP